MSPFAKASDEVTLEALKIIRLRSGITVKNCVSVIKTLETRLFIIKYLSTSKESYPELLVRYILII